MISILNERNTFFSMFAFQCSPMFAENLSENSGGINARKVFVEIVTVVNALALVEKVERT